MHVPPPCKRDCPNRSITCHSTCEDYQKWFKRRRKIKTELNKQKDMEWRNFNGR